MDGTSAVESGKAAPRRPIRRRGGFGGLQGSDINWALAFLVPYVGIFFAFVLLPVGYGLWLGHRPSSYATLFADPIYLRTLVNTALFLAIGVNLHLFLALLLSGYFMN
jgi:multiple sugar transport system permease protein